jgi:hypothetical protein
MPLPLTRIRAPQVLLMAGTLALGLAADWQRGIAGQLLISAGFWAVLVYILCLVERRERQALLACLVIATAAELVLSLGWGLYLYRLGNVPLFVPPGHVLLFLLGCALARRLSEGVAGAIVACAALYAIAAAVAGFDTLALVFLLMLGVAWFALRRERRLFASTLIVALLLEVYGTWLGTWTWSHEVPLTRLMTTNPPALAGALYSTLDALVAVSSVILLRRTVPIEAVVDPAPAQG